MLFGSLGSVVVGTLADTSGWQVAYGFVVALLVAGFLSILGRRTVARVVS
jgi:membrane protein implicated in regulation of membrane protease activity